MTHNDIYTKFMIEYDKANVTSSYPSLTQYEVATILDKAYNALIAQKVTGNNPRRSTFEADTKAVSDLQGLIKQRLLFIGNNSSSKKGNNPFTKIDDYNLTSTNGSNFVKDFEEIQVFGTVRSMPDNMRSADLPYDFLYFISGGVPIDMHTISGWMNNKKFYTSNPETHKVDILHPIDNKQSDYPNEHKVVRFDPMTIMSHKMAEQFYATSYNIPWVKNPACFLEDNKIFIIIDPVASIPDLKYTDYKTGLQLTGEWSSITYIRQPNKFVKDKSIISLSEFYKVDESLKVSCTLDRYNTNGEKEIHINNISRYISGDAQPYLKKYVYYGKLLYSESTDNITAKSFVTQSRSGIVYNETDDSCNLKQGYNLTLIVYNENLGCSKFFTISYNTLYQKLIDSGKIINEDSVWDADSAALSVDISPDDSSWNSFLGADQVEDFDPEKLDIDYFKYTYEDESVNVDNIYFGEYTLKQLYTFELNDTMAEELISLAITFALENVESPRLNSHVQFNALES